MDFLSESLVSRITADLDEYVERHRHRPPGAAGPFTFEVADTTLTKKLREDGRAITAVVLLAIDVNGKGHRDASVCRRPSAAGPVWN